VAEAVERFTANIRKQDSSTTGDWYDAPMKLLVAQFGELAVGRLQVRHVEQWFEGLAARAPEVGGTALPRTRSLATRKSYWLALMRACTWWQKRDYTTSNAAQAYLDLRARRDDPLPWTTKAGKRTLGRGKPQLRNTDEVERYVAVALTLEYPYQRVAACLPVLAGMSSGEILHLAVGDVDFALGLLRVRDDERAPQDDDDEGWCVKTAHRKRTVEIHPALLADLNALVEGRKPTDYVFSQDGDPKPRTASWLRYVARKVCTKAGVRNSPPHGLRGTHSSMLTEVGPKGLERIGSEVGGASNDASSDQGLSAAEVGDALGHGDRGTTARRAYIGAAQRVPCLKVVGGVNAASAIVDTFVDTGVDPIGIGAPGDPRRPLPHHPACGSAPGGSAS
jgi:integrase